MPACSQKLKFSLMLMTGVMALNAPAYAEDTQRAAGSMTHEDAGEILDNLEKNLGNAGDPETTKQNKLPVENSPQAPVDKSVEKSPEKTAEVPADKPSTQPSHIPSEKKEETPKTFSDAESTAASRAIPSRKENGPATTIKSIEAKIQEYDHRIEILESDLARIQSNLNDASVTDNNVLFEIKAQTSAQFVIRDLAAKLDGNSLYDQRDSAGIWMPNHTIEVFNGPLKPGNHSFQIQGVISPLSNDGLKLPTWQHKTVDANFDISIPEGRSRKHFVIELSHDVESSSKPRAKIIESDYK